MKQVTLVFSLALCAVGCDAGELNPDLWHSHYLPGDTVTGGDSGASCALICGKLYSCYSSRSDIYTSCTQRCPTSGVSLASCFACLSPLACAQVEDGGCSSECNGLAGSLTCDPSWQWSTLSCDPPAACTCRPSCTFNSSTSSECNSGCCYSNQCLPACACTGAVSPVACSGP